MSIIHVAIAQVVCALSVVVEVFDVGPSRCQSHPRTTFNFLFMRHEGRLGSG